MIQSRLILLFCTLLAILNPLHGQMPILIEPNVPVPASARLTLSCDKADYALGENVLLNFTLKNVGETSIYFQTGGDYRGVDRPLRFKVKATDEKGHLVPDTDPHRWCMGGMFVPKRELEPGKSYGFTLQFLKYCWINDPGQYTISVTHDFGWLNGESKAPIATITLRFHMPSLQEAQKVCQEMETLPAEDKIRFIDDSGEQLPPFADFSCLRYPVYLALLELKARAGDERALEGIGNMPTYPAEASLLRLANLPNAPEISVSATDMLCWRLPGRNPQEVPGPWIRLAAEGWDPDLKPALLALARRLLNSANNDLVNDGAEMIESVGGVDCMDSIIAALDQALKSPAVIAPRIDPNDDVLDYPPPISRLLNASDALYKRGYTGPIHSPGQELAFLSQYAEYVRFPPFPPTNRPPEWLTLVEKSIDSPFYPVRQAAIDSIPGAVPDSFLPVIERGLHDPDFGVCRAACTAAGKSGHKEFLKRLLEIISTINEKWTLNEATEAAKSLASKYDLDCIWADRLSDPATFEQAIDFLGRTLDGLPGSWGGSSSNLNQAQRLAIRDAWRALLTSHEKELRAGKRFYYKDPAITLKLFQFGDQLAQQWHFPDGTRWPVLPTTTPGPVPRDKVPIASD